MNATASETSSRRRPPVWMVLILLGGALLLVLRLAVFQAFRVPSRSMEPTISVGDYILVTKMTYGYSRYSFAPFEQLFPHGRVFAHPPQRGDVVVFRPTQQANRDFVKRIIGLPGDRVRLTNGTLYLNDRPVPRIPHGTTSECGLSETDPSGPSFLETLPNGISYRTCDRGDNDFLETTPVFIVPAGHYFVLGDARDNSVDSRMASIGYVPFENIIGPVYVPPPRGH